MIEENEVIRLLLGLGVLVYALSVRSRLMRVPRCSILFGAFTVLLGGWTLTVLEGLIWEASLNALEHLCYAVSAILLLWWCWQVFKREASRP